MRLPVTSVRGVLIATVPSDIELGQVADLQQALLRAVMHERARGAVLDVSPVRVLDRFDAEAILKTAQMTQLLGAPLVVVGLSAHNAAAWAELGSVVDALWCAATVEDALSRIDAATERPA